MSLTVWLCLVPFSSNSSRRWSLSDVRMASYARDRYSGTRKRDTHEHTSRKRGTCCAHANAEKGARGKTLIETECVESVHSLSGSGYVLERSHRGLMSHVG